MVIEQSTAEPAQRTYMCASTLCDTTACNSNFRRMKIAGATKGRTSRSPVRCWLGRAKRRKPGLELRMSRWYFVDRGCLGIIFWSYFRLTNLSTCTTDTDNNLRSANWRGIVQILLIAATKGDSELAWSPCFSHCIVICTCMFFVWLVGCESRTVFRIHIHMQAIRACRMGVQGLREIWMAFLSQSSTVQRVSRLVPQ